MKTLTTRILIGACSAGLVLSAAAQQDENQAVTQTSDIVVVQSGAIVVQQVEDQVGVQEEDDQQDQQADVTPISEEVLIRAAQLQERLQNAQQGGGEDQQGGDRERGNRDGGNREFRGRDRERMEVRTINPIPVRTPGQAFGQAEAVESAFRPPAEGNSTNAAPGEIRLNFRNAPLEMVLSYLSDAAGFIIMLETRVSGTISVISSHPVSRDEAVDLLNSALVKNGYAAIRSGRTLTIVDRNTAKTRDIPVKVGNDPDAVPRNDEIVTQIIPIRFVEARQLAVDISSFVSPGTAIVANEAGNSLVVTDTQSNIRHLMEIVRAIDGGAEGETSIKVFKLKHASPTDVATVLGTIFPANGTGGSQSPFRFGGNQGRGGGNQGRGGGGGFQGGGPGAFFANLMGGQNGSQNARQKATQVIAVADNRTSSVVVTASKDLMGEIEGMINELDISSTRDQGVYVFRMENGDPQQAAQVLQSMFQSTTGGRAGGVQSGSQQNSALMQRQVNNASSSSGSVNSSTATSGFGGAGGGAARAGGS
jgi:hypothetical protein